MQQLLIRLYSACTGIPLLRRMLRNTFIQQCCRILGANRYIRVHTKQGFHLWLDILNIRTADEIRRTGFYEPACSRFLLEQIHSGMNVIDAGANIGYYTLLCSQAVGSTGTVFAFEPDVRCLPLLQKNSASNNCRNVQIIERCLSDGSGSVPLYISEHTAMSSLTKSNVLAASSVSVPCTTIDAEMQKQGKPPIDLIKMDIQGAELQCLRGATETLSQNPGICLLIEFWPEGLKRAGTNPVDLLQFLTRKGFSIRCIEHDQYGDPGVHPEAFTEKVMTQAHDVYDCYVDIWAWRE